MISRVTISGADDGVDPAVLFSLSQEFPFVEWGILFSASRHGEPRYPSGDWLVELHTQKMRDARVGMKAFRLSAHFCGRCASDTLSGLSRWMEAVNVDFDRVQINGWVPGSVGLGRLAKRYPLQFILQVRSPERMEDAVIEAVELPNGSLLIDPSGGRGRLLDLSGWTRPGMAFGLAGGFDPDNIGGVFKHESLRKSAAATWVDMESGVRDSDNRLDLRKVRRVLETAAPWINAPAVAGGVG